MSFIDLCTKFYAFKTFERAWNLVKMEILLLPNKRMHHEHVLFYFFQVQLIAIDKDLSMNIYSHLKLVVEFNKY